MSRRLFAQQPLDFFDALRAEALTPGAYMLGNILAAEAFRSRGLVLVRPVELAELLKVSSQSIRNWLRQLKALDWIDYDEVGERGRAPWRIRLTGLATANETPGDVLQSSANGSSADNGGNPLPKRVRAANQLQSSRARKEEKETSPSSRGREVSYEQEEVEPLPPAEQAARAAALGHRLRTGTELGDPSAPPGPCDSCGREAALRWLHGSFSLCARCRLDRSKGDRAVSADRTTGRRYSFEAPDALHVQVDVELEQAALEVVRLATPRRRGNRRYYEIPAEAFDRLRAALGEGTLL